MVDIPPGCGPGTVNDAWFRFVIDMGADDARAGGMEGKWMFTLQKPSMIPFLQYADKRELREEIFKAYINRGSG